MEAPRLRCRGLGVSDVAHRCVSSAPACLHGLAEAAVLAAGYAPAIGFLHTGRPLSFVYDIADLFKIETVVPAAFEVAGKAARGKLDMPVESAVRRACRNALRKTGLLEKILPQIEDVLAAAGISVPEEPAEAQHAVLFIGTGAGDAGYRG